MNLLLIALLPFTGALLPPLAGRLGRGAAAWAAAIVPALALLLAAFAGTPLTVSWPWLPQAGFDLILRMDGLAALFILLILGIGLLIILYANYYLLEDDPPGRFFALLLLFMGSMVGIVLSDHLLQLLVFWELTSLRSFLLARLFPALAGTDLWFFAVGGTGLVTLLYGAYTALFRHYLKGLLAYSTISHLGLIVLLFGIDTPLAAVAGVPLLNGFMSKEMFFAEILHLTALGQASWLLPAAAPLAGILAVAYSARFVHDVFFNGEPVNLPRYPPHEAPRYMLLPVAVLVGQCLLVGVFPNVTVAPFLALASADMLGGSLPAYDLAIWHGFNAPFMMSLTALIALSVVGLLAVLTFARFSAPDLALTQLAVEVVTIMLLLALYFALLDNLCLAPGTLHGIRPRRAAERHSLVLAQITRFLLPLALMVSIYLFLRGHNAPGGGFIAGLITAIALILQYMASGIAWTQQQWRQRYHMVIAWGLIIAIFTGSGSWLFDHPFLTSAFGHFKLPVIGAVELATAMLFDLGVYFTVVGVVADPCHSVKTEQSLSRGTGGRLMELLASLVIAVLFACGIYLVLRARTFQVALGLSLLSYAVNLFLFFSGRLATGAPPLAGGTAATADPLPQALVLTAIGFGMTAFVVALALRARGELGNDHVDGGHAEPAADKRAAPPGGLRFEGCRPAPASLAAGPLRQRYRPGGGAFCES